MNRVNRQMYALLLTVTVAATIPVYATEREIVDIIYPEQKSTVVVENTPWYRKRSTHIAAAVTCAAATYAIAVRMNKIASPFVLLAALYESAVVSKNTNTPVDNSNDDSSVENNTNVVVENDTNISVTPNQEDGNGEVVVNENAPVSTGKRSLKSFFTKLHELNDAWNCI